MGSLNLMRTYFQKDLFYSFTFMQNCHGPMYRVMKCRLNIMSAWANDPNIDLGAKTEFVKGIHFYRCHDITRPINEILISSSQ